MTGPFRDKFAIVGIGQTPTARTHAPGLGAMTLEAWAARLAIEDAGLARENIDGAVHTVMGSPHPPAQWPDEYARMLGLRPSFYLTVGRGGQTAHNGILLAAQALEAGLARYVLVTCGLPGWSATHGQAADKRSPNGLPLQGGYELGLAQTGWRGALPGAGVHAFLASRHMHEYGTTYEQLGAVALSARRWANLNPAARFHDRPLTMDEYLASPFVVSPLRKLDCCVQSDLGSAVIVTTAERARSLRRDPIYIKGLGLGDQARHQLWEKSHYTQTDGAFALRHALSQAALSIHDVDVAELYDCFTTEVILYVEDYGLCQKGEGGPFVAEGHTAPGGSFPVNTHGGLHSGMYLFDFPNVIEAVVQLRHLAGERQVASAEVALVNGHGGELLPPMMCSSHACMVLGRELS